MNTDENTFIGFQAISWCPLEYENKIVQDKCLINNFLETGPPVAVGKNFVFKNKYCALCNDEPMLMTESRNECQKWSEEVERSNFCVHLETFANYEIHLEYIMVSAKNHTKSELIAIGLVSFWTVVVTNFTQCSGYILLKESESKMVKVSTSLQVLKKSFSNEIPVIEKSFQDHRIDIMKDNDTEQITMIKKKSPISSTKDDSHRFNKIIYLLIVPDQKEAFLKYLLPTKNINISAINDKFCSHQKVSIDVMPEDGIFILSDAIRCDETKQIIVASITTCPVASITNCPVASKTNSPVASIINQTSYFNNNQPSGLNDNLTSGFYKTSPVTLITSPVASITTNTVALITRPLASITTSLVASITTSPVTSITTSPMASITSPVASITTIPGVSIIINTVI
ncbi:unnamed protein product [Mytilus coruscus]|uniref:Uncharacterized protein n=1 Tax=Mytilus coruscus TaxID=42192 RepID=A0A6J8D2L1_MYTCO|nr:unnamed protein product [Mytilus coruscus]